MDSETLKNNITEALEAEYIDVVDESDGCGMKFQVTVVSR
jgi:stress-induced morphogen